MLSLNPEDRKPFNFGVAKAEMILNNIDDIIAFVEECGDQSVVDNFRERVEST